MANVTAGGNFLQPMNDRLAGQKSTVTKPQRYLEVQLLGSAVLREENKGTNFY